MIADIKDWTLQLRYMDGPNDFGCMAVIILVWMARMVLGLSDLNAFSVEWE